MSRLLVVHKPQHSSKPSVTIYRPLGRFKTPGGTLKTPIKSADRLGCSDCRLVMRGRLLVRIQDRFWKAKKNPSNSFSLQPQYWNTKIGQQKMGKHCLVCWVSIAMLCKQHESVDLSMFRPLKVMQCVGDVFFFLVVHAILLCSH